MVRRLGLIAGGGDFPILFAGTAKQKNISLVCAALKNEADPRLEELVDKIYWVDLGEVKKVIEVFKREKIKKAVMLGKVTKTRFFKDRPPVDDSANLVLKLAKDKRDLTLLKTAAMVLGFSGIKLISSLVCLEDHLAKKGCLTRKYPTKQEWGDIYFGYKIARKMAGLDIGQTVVVKDKAILAVEAIEGTDSAIKRGGKLGNGGAVVVKAARPRQDLRFDIPVIGPHTIQSLIDSEASVFALEKGKTLITEKETLTRMADKANISVVVI
ncbi:MAG: UDP-2,3-diacylglucosamine diphosphatase LpxI [Candidatus Omnitrophota bacterium]